MAGNESPKWKSPVEEILRRLRVGEEEQLTDSLAQHLKACLKRIDAFCDLLEEAEKPGIADQLCPPDPWSSIFPVMFETLLERMPAIKACTAAFLMGQLWRMHEHELLNADY